MDRMDVNIIYKMAKVFVNTNRDRDWTTPSFIIITTCIYKHISCFDCMTMFSLPFTEKNISKSYANREMCSFHLDAYNSKKCLKHCWHRSTSN